MSLDENKAIVRRIIEEGWNKGDLDVIDELLAINFVDHNIPPAPIPGIELFKQAIIGLRAAFPDGHTAIEDMIAEGDKVVVRWTARGTHRGALMGIPPTGKEITTMGIATYRIAGGKAVENWTNSTALSMLQQLGVLPPLGQ